MVFDFHTHCFPKKIREAAMHSLRKKGGIPSFSDASPEMLIASMKKAGIDFSLVLPIATSPKQQASILAYALELNGKNGLFSLGSVHPAADDAEEFLEKTACAGLRGIKLHPDYQGIEIDDPRILKVIDHAHSLGLFTLLHAGKDVAYPAHVHCPPKKAAALLEKLSGKNVILAHLGGYGEGEAAEVLSSLCGADIYFDTSYVGTARPKESAAIIAAHRPDRLLFGSDSPWADQDQALTFIQNLSLSSERKEAILFGNAATLMGLT